MINRGRFHYTDTEKKRILKDAVILTDSREQRNEHILSAFDRFKTAHKTTALSFGDYSVMLLARLEAGITRDMYFDAEIVIERKADLDELAGNFTIGRERFKDEMIRAADARKYLLVEQSGGYAAILSHQYKSKLSEKSFFATLLSFQARYGLNVIFCEPDKSADIIWGLLYYHMRTWLSGEG
jgi:ERCC4-type nuclease